MFARRSRQTRPPERKVWIHARTEGKDNLNGKGRTGQRGPEGSPRKAEWDSSEAN